MFVFPASNVFVFFNLQRPLEVCEPLLWKTKMKYISSIFILIGILPLVTFAGPLAYGICQTGCNAVVVACYAAAGFTFGTVTAGAGIPAAIIACNGALGICMAGCIAAGFAPTLWFRCQLIQYQCDFFGTHLIYFHYAWLPNEWFKYTTEKYDLTVHRPLEFVLKIQHFWDSVFFFADRSSFFLVD